MYTQKMYENCVVPEKKSTHTMEGSSLRALTSPDFPFFKKIC